MIKAFIFPYLYCLLLGSSWAVCFKKKFAESLAPAFMLHIILVLLSGMLFHKLSIGIWGGVILSILVIIISIKRAQKVKCSVDYKWKSDIVIFSIFYILCFLINIEKRFLFWDEYTHWGMFVKEALRLDALYVESEMIFWHKDYISATALFEVIICSIIGRFSEASVFFAIQLFTFSMIFQIFSFIPECKKDTSLIYKKQTDKLKRFIFIIAFIIIPIIFKDPPSKFYHSIVPDVALGVSLFYCCLISLQNYHKNYQMIIISLSLLVLILIKPSGVLLLPIFVLFYIIKEPLQSRVEQGHPVDKNSKLPKEISTCFTGLLQVLNYFLKFIFLNIRTAVCRASFILMLSLPSLFILYLWNIFVANNIPDNFHELLFNGRQSYSSLPTILNSFFENPIEYIIELDSGIGKKLLKALFVEDIILYGAYIPLVMIIYNINFMLQKKKFFHKNILPMNRFIFLVSIMYAIQIYILYVIVFPKARALVLGSYERYATSFIIFTFLLTIITYIYSDIWKEKIHNHHIFIIIVLCFFLLDGKSFSHTVSGISGLDKNYISSARDAALKIYDISNAEGDIFIINRKSNDTDFMRIKFYLSPMIVNGGSFGKPINRNDTWSKEIAPEKLLKEIKLHDYLYIGFIDKYFVDRYYAIFENPSVIKNNSIFKIIDGDNNLIRLSEFIEMNKDDASLRLLKAAKNGWEQELRQAIADGADIEYTDRRGNTPFMLASYYGNRKLAQILLKNGANINAVDHNMETVLMKSVKSQKTSTAKFLITQKADCNIKNRNGLSAISFSSMRSNKSMINILLNNGADIKDAWFSASWNGRIDIVKFLFNKKMIDINAHDNKGWTALMHAAFHGRENIVKFLITKGVILNSVDNVGETALMKAVINDNLKTVQLLLDAGADVNITRNDGVSVLKLANDRGNDRIINLIKTQFSSQ